MKSSYKNRCLLERRHLTTCSYFLGICFSTSDFSLLNRKGLKTCSKDFNQSAMSGADCHLEIPFPSFLTEPFGAVGFHCRSILKQTLWSLLTSPSLYSLLPSIIPDRGLENHSLKSLCDWNRWGMRKCMRDQSSIKLFWSGVPVSSSRRWLLKFNRYCHLCDLKFLMFWACVWQNAILESVVN